ncbi:hypothetical protein OAO87_04280 [bacterium]|nr:hypothetical protein [bacterium]
MVSCFDTSHPQDTAPPCALRLSTRLSFPRRHGLLLGGTAEEA